MRTIFSVFFISFIVFSVNESSADPALDDATLESQVRSSVGVFMPLPDNMFSPGEVVPKEKIALGKKLYLETDLSVKKDLSCNSCHKLDNFGVDNEATSPGTDGQKGNRNSPSSFNAALHVAQFWDGRAKDVEEQALGPILNPIEMGMASEEEVVKRLKANPEYQSLFAKAFPQEKDPISYKNVGKVIGAFERTLVTPSRFDDYLKGNSNALSKEEKKGLLTFVRSGCIMCHSGVGLGGHMYQKLGLVKPYPTKDLGRFEVTKNESDTYFFKVPSLRNVEKTAPYFHDGSVKTIEEAVKLMGSYQLGKELSEEEVTDIVTFLKSLTGTLKK